ncbi:hypothetical protein J437_LFUL003025 [Ladona fulva]|uniref:CTP synthase N-terminal domain-containing protein n=1 Tax=Ladona fulva TaxID=123851 RepID=A0A8K0JVQ8_LADFU|nr:hypothetical protein J437_LFUL003025 [Ladona fulva]
MQGYLIFSHFNFIFTFIFKMKYILVTGGVISGVGKGVIASSFGTILKSCGIHVTSIKIDPYINIDAGTFSPYEHGEVYVLDDGGEVDLDLGNYERFLDITLHKHNNITTGKIYQHVISKERRGDYLGKTVQVVPHITDAIQEWVERVAMQSVTEDGDIPEVCIVELGGTIGDIEGMPFVEAFRQFQFRVKKENFCCVHVSLVPQVTFVLQSVNTNSLVSQECCLDKQTENLSFVVSLFWKLSTKFLSKLIGESHSHLLLEIKILIINHLPGFKYEMHAVFGKILVTYVQILFALLLHLNSVVFLIVASLNHCGLSWFYIL